MTNNRKERFMEVLLMATINKIIRRTKSDIDFCLTYPNEFKKAFKNVPKYKRDAIVELINSANDMD